MNRIWHSFKRKVVQKNIVDSSLQTQKSFYYYTSPTLFFGVKICVNCKKRKCFQNCLCSTFTFHPVRKYMQKNEAKTKQKRTCHKFNVLDRLLFFITNKNIAKFNWTELKTLEWWISGLMLDPLFMIISRLT